MLLDGATPSNLTLAFEETLRGTHGRRPQSIGRPWGGLKEVLGSLSYGDPIDGPTFWDRTYTKTPGISGLMVYARSCRI